MKKEPSLVRTRADLRVLLDDHRKNGLTIGFVPTMGALHDGHLSLVGQARARADIVVASIFVNPTQFAPGEDLEIYPRTEDEDIAKLHGVGCDIVYLPSVNEMYPEGSMTNVRVEEMSDLLDGRFRPHFFYGVATIVARLFIHVGPDVAAFGEKDYQQLQIIRRMVRDLGFATEIIGASTVRDSDGLAQSSRNTYLSKEQRSWANEISRALHRASVRLAAGVPVDTVCKEASAAITSAGFDKLDYVSVVDPSDLKELTTDTVQRGQTARVLAAAWIGSTRLIDNMAVCRPS